MGSVINFFVAYTLFLECSYLLIFFAPIPHYPWHIKQVRTIIPPGKTTIEINLFDAIFYNGSMCRSLYAHRFPD